MTDVLVLVGVGVAIAAFVWFFIIRDTDEKTDVYVGTAKADPVNRSPGGPKAKAPAKKLPTAKTMESMSKAKLEELGREHGVELDKRKTKAKMIADLRLGVK